MVNDVQVYYTPAGQAVVNFDLLVEDDGSTIHRNFIPVVARGEIVERSRQYLKKENKILVEGKLQSRKYNAADGERRVVLEVVAEEIKIIDN